MSSMLTLDVIWADVPSHSYTPASEDSRCVIVAALLVIDRLNRECGSWPDSFFHVMTGVGLYAVKK